MTKPTLTFTSLEEIAQFAKQLQGGYVLNTINLTLTITLPEAEVENVPLINHHDKQINWRVLS
jgi:hypothetical protein